MVFSFFSHVALFQALSAVVPLYLRLFSGSVSNMMDRIREALVEQQRTTSLVFSLSWPVREYSERLEKRCRG